MYVNGCVLTVRDKLMDMDFKEWPAEVGRMVPFYGQSMARSAEIFFEKGDIDRRTYIMLSSSTSSS